ncbi:MAG TPA: hypothetical protein GXX75_09080 [Clostridiales bacterium]|nr:hypothetical protein [Clostridiales bacterium]
MKRIYKIFLCSLFFVFLFSSRVNADQASFSVIGVDDSSYSPHFFLIVNVDGGGSDVVNAYIGKSMNRYIVNGIMFKGKEIIEGKYTWENPDYVIVKGDQYVNLIFTSDNNLKLTLKIYLNGVEMPVKEKVPVSIDERDVVPEEPAVVGEVTTPSLTVTSVTLATSTAYDINIVDNIKGTKYAFESSNPKVATVNPKNGIVKAVKPGNATITCNATLPDGRTETLKSDIIVGYDENAPMLTEEALDLSINDVFYITVENQIAKSKYKYASSDWSKVRVNSASGKIRAVGEGEAYVTCTITTPDKQVIVLRCDITITN